MRIAARGNGFYCLNTVASQLTQQRRDTQRLVYCAGTQDSISKQQLLKPKRLRDRRRNLGKQYFSSVHTIKTYIGGGHEKVKK